MMSEEFLQFLWKFRLFESNDLYTTAGEPVQIMKPGEANADAGPDFSNARIKIGNTLWAGNVEVHMFSSDWKKHHHPADKAYDNIILHVVLEENEKVIRKNKEAIPTIELKQRINSALYVRYQRMMNNRQWIPCENQINNAGAFVVESWLERMMIERLETRCESIMQTLKISKNNWEETFYQHLARNFGFNLNAVPFEMLAKSLPQKFLTKHKDNLFQIETLLLGQAGFLEKDYKDDYPQQLKKEYLFLKQKYSLHPIEGHLWKFLRIRPSGFPTIRIAQFANLIRKSNALFSKVIECINIVDLRKLFQIKCSDYWVDHFTFDKAAPAQKKTFTDASVDLLLINTVITFLFVYGLQKNEEAIKERALSFLEKIKPEKNAIIKKWKDIGMPANNAFQTQALLQLKKNYCSNKKCLHCAIGNKLLQSV
jgi:hypothetical protein